MQKHIMQDFYISQELNLFFLTPECRQVLDAQSEDKPLTAELEVITTHFIETSHKSQVTVVGMKQVKQVTSQVIRNSDNLPQFSIFNQLKASEHIS